MADVKVCDVCKRLLDKGEGYIVFKIAMRENDTLTATDWNSRDGEEVCFHCVGSGLGIGLQKLFGIKTVVSKAIGK